MKPKAALLALSIGAFAIGTTEFTPMGLLPVIADGVQVSIPTAGMLVSAYAIGVMVGAPIMTLLFSRFGKRAALMGASSMISRAPEAAGWLSTRTAVAGAARSMTTRDRPGANWPKR